MKAFALALVLVTATPLLGGEAAKPKKPGLELRSTPRFGFSPLNVLFVAELKGGEDVEEFYCPEIEWDWDDGGKSVKESDCPAYENGVTHIERRFSQEHFFVRAGNYAVKVTMRRTNHLIAKQTITVTVRPGLGDPSNSP
jgi:PKD repeat protein